MFLESDLSIAQDFFTYSGPVLMNKLPQLHLCIYSTYTVNLHRFLCF